MKSTDERGLLWVFIVAAFAAALNHAYASYQIGNSYCSYDTCTGHSQRCAGSGSCSYCLSGNLDYRCAYALNSVCVANEGTIQSCGDMYVNGTCVGEVCSGGNHPEGQRCGMAKCDMAKQPKQNPD